MVCKLRSLCYSELFIQLIRITLEYTAQRQFQMGVCREGNLLCMFGHQNRRYCTDAGTSGYKMCKIHCCGEMRNAQFAKLFNY